MPAGVADDHVFPAEQRTPVGLTDCAPAARARLIVLRAETLAAVDAALLELRATEHARAAGSGARVIDADPGVAGGVHAVGATGNGPALGADTTIRVGVVARADALGADAARSHKLMGKVSLAPGTFLSAGYAERPPLEALDEAARTVVRVSQVGAVRAVLAVVLTDRLPAGCAGAPVGGAGGVMAYRAVDDPLVACITAEQMLAGYTDIEARPVAAPGARLDGMPMAGAIIRHGLEGEGRVAAGEQEIV